VKFGSSNNDAEDKSVPYRDESVGEKLCLEVQEDKFINLKKNFCEIVYSDTKLTEKWLANQELFQKMIVVYRWMVLKM
jgi:hypothetical protein